MLGRHQAVGGIAGKLLFAANERISFRMVALIGGALE